jgi:hypothetical protein
MTQVTVQVVESGGVQVVEVIGGGGSGGGATNLSVANRGATTLDVASDTGTDATIPAATASLTGLMASADKTKLDGVAAGATANASDAQLRDRSTHTGTQAASTITDFDASSRSQVEAMLTAGTNVTLTPSGSGATRSIQISATAGGGGVSAVSGTAPIVSSGGATPAISITEASGSAAGSMSSADFTKLSGIATGATANSSDATLLSRANHTGTQAVGTITGLGTLATQSGTFSGTSSGTNTGDQTISNSSTATSHTVSLSASGGTVQFVEGANITLTTTGTSAAGVVTIAATGGAGVTDGDKGDITVSGTGATWTIDNGAVTLAKQANLATQTLIGRNTAGSGVPEAVTLSQLLDWSTTTQGSVLFRGASGWQSLPPGTVGQVLQSGGAAANPSWITASGGGNAQTGNPLSQFAATTSAQLAGVISDETGTGQLVFGTSPTLVTPILGTPSSGTLTSCTGLPISTGVSGLGTGIAAALAINTGSAGAPVLFNGALGTPSSGALTSCTGLPISTGVSGLGTGVATFLATPSSANFAAAVTGETGTGALVFGTAPAISAMTVSSAVTITAGTNAQGQGALTNDLNIATTTANNPSGLTLPTATVGRSVTVINRGSNPISLYPASGAQIDFAAPNDPISIPFAGRVTLIASSATQWHSSRLEFVSPTFTTPALGTPSSGTLTNCTGLPGSALTGAYTASAMTMATARLLGRTTAAAGAAEEISVGANLTLSGGSLAAASTNVGYTASTRVITSSTGTGFTLPLFTSTDPGLTPLSGGGTTNFLRADGTWAAPAGGGGTDQPLYFDAAEFIPRTTNGCGISSEETATSRINRDLLTFDPGAIEYAQKGFAWPVGWATATATFFWKASSGTGSCVWAARMRIFSDGDAEDQAMGTAQSVTDAAASANTHRQTSATAAITPGGTVTSGRHCILEVYRDATNGSDDLGVDALLIGIVLTKAS